LLGSDYAREDFELKDAKHRLRRRPEWAVLDFKILTRSAPPKQTMNKSAF